MSAVATKPKLAVWKFSSCDGCQLTLLDCEDELLAIAGELELAYFPEATKAELAGPYDVSLVEGSITTAHDAERIHEIREQSKLLVTIGACATAGGIQALRNFADVKEWIPLVYASPEFISTLATSTPIADHVKVDLELRGCPISKAQLARDGARAAQRPAAAPADDERLLRVQGARHAVRDGRKGTPCLGPVTQAGCGAICPAYNRGCYGCFGPMESPNMPALVAQWRALGARTARSCALCERSTRTRPHSARRA